MMPREHAHLTLDTRKLCEAIEVAAGVSIAVQRPYPEEDMTEWFAWANRDVDADTRDTGTIRTCTVAAATGDSEAAVLLDLGRQLWPRALDKLDAAIAKARLADNPEASPSNQTVMGEVA